MKLEKLWKPDNVHQNKRTIYNVHKAFKDISMKNKHFSKLHTHIK
jgi:hypothetical protein